MFQQVAQHSWLRLAVVSYAVATVLLMSHLRLVSRPPPLLSTDEVAHRLSVSRKTVYRLIHAGSLPAVKTSDTGRAHLKVDEQDLEAWIAEHRGLGRG